MTDRHKLNILDPHVMPKATEHVPLMIELIQKLIDKGHAYVAADGVYFDVTTFPGYGTRLNAEPPEERMAGARVEGNENKRHPADFALWRRAKAGDLQQWDSPWGRGNPGWHIECSAMSMKYLGETFDLHSGGEDHLFPHHECEIAQSEAATGKPFVNYWVHVRFLRVDSEKMAKSKGGFVTLEDVAGWGYDPLAFRLLALGAGYRNGLDFTRDGMNAAQSRLERWRRTIRAAYAATQGRVAEPEGEHVITREFREALADDLNSPRALAAAEKALALAAIVDTDEQERALWMLFDMDRVLGLSLGAEAAAGPASAHLVRPTPGHVLSSARRARNSGPRRSVRSNSRLVKRASSRASSQVTSVVRRSVNAVRWAGVVAPVDLAPPRRAVGNGVSAAAASSGTAKRFAALPPARTRPRRRTNRWGSPSRVRTRSSRRSAPGATSGGSICRRTATFAPAR